MIKIIENNNDFYEKYRDNVAPIVVWGAGEWGEIFVHDTDLPIACFCDIHKSKETMYNYDVLSPEELYEKYENTHIYILNSVGGDVIKESTVYQSICAFPYDAELVNIHKNIGILKSKYGFVYKNKKYDLFQHLYICGLYEQRMNQRALEISIAREWIKHYEDVFEIGAVTPYYFPQLVENIFDLADEHYCVTEKKSIFDIDLHEKNVLCLETMDSVGMGRYGVDEKRKADMAMDKVLEESNHCLIVTAFNNFIKNEALIKWIVQHFCDEEVTIFYRSGIGNQWKILENQEFLEVQMKWDSYVQHIYDKRKIFGGNCLVAVIEK